jgi:type I restriction enzyme, R subunit
VDSERATRQQRIDLQLARAGWGKGAIVPLEEYLLDGNALNDDSAPPTSPEFVDYALPDAHGQPLAIVEAKRASRDPLVAQRQAADYAERIKSTKGANPFVFLANGNEILFWRRSLYPPRPVSGFFTLEDLERIAFLDRFREPLAGAAVNTHIVDRAYQIEAIKTVAEQVESSHRKFLLVLATGTGKTRVAIALVELLRRQKWIQRVLFLADRRELVKQALAAFKEHLPDAPRCWIEGGEIDKGARIHVATYPGMMGIYQKLSPGYYDLIICDESHRSIYEEKSYGGIFDYFDALLLGLTATPTDFIGHDTYKLFNCEKEKPTFYYSYPEAVRDRNLVPYRPVHVAKTAFQIQGLKPGQIPLEITAQLRKQGVDPESFAFENTDLEKRVTNTGTNDAIVAEFMDQSIKDAAGTVPAKSIIFAISHRHALELLKSFNRRYPNLQRRGMAEVIDSQIERAEKTLDDFKNKDFPRVAISVDMLDTGIDVPSIRNLVFAKPVFSRVKFWQMIGRGTRKWTDPTNGEEKKDFLIIDHWDNFAYFQVEKDGREPAASEPMPSRLFRLRLEKMQILAGRNLSADADVTRSTMQSMLGSLPLDNINVAPNADELRQLANEAAAWQPLDQDRVDRLSNAIAPLLRFSTAAGYPQLQFDTQTERLALAHLKADLDEVTRLEEAIRQNLELLPKQLPEVRAHLESLTFALSTAFWANLDYERIMRLQTTFGPLMRFRARREQGQIIRLSLPDDIAQRHWIVFGPGGEGTFAENYRAKVEALILTLVSENPALQKLRQGQELTDDELTSIATLLSAPDLFVSEDRLRVAYDQPHASLADFLKHILTETKLPSREEKISAAFDGWVRQHPHLSATQLMFVRTLRRAVLERAEISSLEQLRQPPFNVIGDPESLFQPNDLREMLHLVQSAAA